ncbi:MAG: PEP/pyruvate-binding domain-containing protein [Thermodesulfobacteriota bacterium]
MNTPANRLNSEPSADFKVFHELMAIKVREILLVSSPYDAFVIEEDGSLASRIINEYRGLNLSMPPRVRRTGSAREALEIIRAEKIDIVLAMPHLDDMDAVSLSLEIKKLRPDLPVILLAHSFKGIAPFYESRQPSGIDKVFIWSGNSDLLLALVKNVEDRLNVDRDTRKALVRVLILVEDSPVYHSTFLPLIYKEIVRQTQALLLDGLNEDHRLLKMRARPKILLAENFEEALTLFQKYRPYLFGVISDTRMPREGKLADDGGFMLLSRIRQEIPDLPLLMLSSDPLNRRKAEEIPAVFIDKNSPNLPAELHEFFLSHLGFGDFVFRMPDGREIGRASDLHSLEVQVTRIPEESLWYHAGRNHFSNWIMARSEIALASQFRAVQASEFDSPDELRRYLVSNIRRLRQWRQKGVVSQFRGDRFDADIMEFVKIGQGSMGGKGRSLAFMSGLLQHQSAIIQKYNRIRIHIPKTLVISTDGFESFIAQNDLRRFAGEDHADAEVAANFLKADMPAWILKELEIFLSQVNYPLSVRSSSLLEDTHFQPYAGLYQTYMIPNNHPDPAVRLRQLVTAVKLVYASAYYEEPRAFARRTATQAQEEAMAVLVQQLAGGAHGPYFYPTLSGVAQSYNFYPFSKMKPEEGIAVIALGLGKTVVDGERAVRFSPRYPDVLPQFSTVDDILANTQRHFYALRIHDYPETLNFQKDCNLEKREVADAEEEFPVQAVAGTYIAEEHRVRDSGHIPGPKVITFAPILKYGGFPLPELLLDLLEISRRSMGCPVELEFSVNLNSRKGQKNEFYFLQMRPMVAGEDHLEVQIGPDDIRQAFCRSEQAMGNGRRKDIRDMVYVKPDAFDPNATVRIAEEIDRINAGLQAENRPYLLVGPGRWGSADRWLGIPVRWRSVSAVAAIVELQNEHLKADPSQGTHFFQNITALGIHYLTISETGDGFFDWDWVRNLPVAQETAYVRHARLAQPMVLKLDGRTSRGVILKPDL